MFLLVLTALGTFLVTRKHRHNASEPPLLPPAVCFPEPTTSSKPTLEGEFEIFDHIDKLPRSVQPAFRDKDHGRWVIADPGEKFEATDLITDTSLPGRRLIFWGRSDDEIFVYFEQGGLGLSFVVDAFRAGTPDMEPVWRRYCRRVAHNFDDLKNMIGSGECPIDSDWRCNDHSKE